MKAKFVVFHVLLLAAVCGLALTITPADATSRQALVVDERARVMSGHYGAPPANPNLPAKNAPAAPTGVARTSLRLNEIAPASSSGHEAWIELSVLTGNIYLPIIAKGAGAVQSAPQAQPGTPQAVEAVYLNIDGYAFALPSQVLHPPLNGFIVVHVGINGTNDYDFGDGVAHVYAPSAQRAVFAGESSYVGLYTDAVFSATTIADFVAWGDDTGTADDHAASAGIWDDGAALMYDAGFGADGQAIPAHPNESYGRYRGVWASYRARNSSQGRPNPIPLPMQTMTPDGMHVNVEALQMVWTPVPGAAGYEFQLSTTPSFASLLVNLQTGDPGWAPASPLAPGEYYWRVRVLDSGGGTSAFFGPFHVFGLTLPAQGVNKKLLDPADARLQRKDTTMLDIGGGPGNTSSGSPRTGTRNRWDGPHVNNTTDNFPTFSWNGYDNLACVRASVAMMTLYYGGNLSIDRINYYIFEEHAKADYPSKGSPEGDMGFGKGASSTAPLEWALNAQTDAQSFCPDPPDSVDADSDTYRCSSDDPNTVAVSITFSLIKSLIDSGRPFIAGTGGHVRVVDGYFDTNDVGFSDYVHLWNPVPFGSDDCVPGACSGETWETPDYFASRTVSIGYLRNGESPDPRSDEPSVGLDSDGDGVNNFDEIVRFKTDPYKYDSDGDGVSDKNDIAEYVFNVRDEYQKRFADVFIPLFGQQTISDAEGDSLRKEVDWDNDGDGIPDGCEDTNRDGRYGVASGNTINHTGESDNFDLNSARPCIPILFPVSPTTNHPEDVGSILAPDLLVVKVAAFLPAVMDPQPVYTKDNFSVTIGAKNASILATAKSGVYYLLVQPPTQIAPGLYDMRIDWRQPYNSTHVSTNLTVAQSVHYSPPPVQNPTSTVRSVVLALDTSRYLSNTAYLSATQNAARLFADQWGAQDRLGLVTFGAGVALTAVPLAQVNNGVIITTIKTAINGLAPAGDSALGTALNTAQNQLSLLGDLNGSLHIGAFAAGQSSIAPFMPAFFNDTEGDIGGFASLPTNGACLCAGDTFSRTHIHTLGLGGSNDNFIAGLERAADATAGSLGAVGIPTATSPYLPATLENRLANDFKYAAERMRGEQRLLEAWGTTTGLNHHTYSVTLDAATTIAFATNFAGNGARNFDVFRPDGSLVQSGDSGVQYRTDPTHEQFRVSNPMTGTWRMEVRSSGLVVGHEYLLIVSANARATLAGADPVFRGVTALSLTPETGKSLPLKAALADGATIAGAVVTATVLRSDGSLVVQRTLLDNGQNGDGPAGDGVYGGVFTPTQPGAYIVKFTATGHDNAGRRFARFAQADFAIPRALAYIYTEHDMPESFTGYRALLAESSIPLIAVADYAITATNWGKYSLVVVGADGAAPGKDWLTPEARSAVTNSLVPVVGLFNGGYELFRNLGLDIGTNVTRTGNMTRTMPFEPSYVVWHLPYPLAGILPYKVYTASAGLNLNLPSVLPGVTNIGLLPATPRVNIVREDGRFLLWGWRLGPAWMTGDGRRIFKNVVAAMMR